MIEAIIKRITALLSWYVRDDLQEGILGDLEEKINAKYVDSSSNAAKRSYLWQAIGFFHPQFRRPGLLSFGHPALWKNYLVASRRTIGRNGQFFAINLVGMVVAISCLLFCTVLIQDELSYDAFHKDLDSIHRVYKRHLNPREDIDRLTAETSGLLGPTLVSNYPEVESFCRVFAFEDENIYHEDQNYRSAVTIMADSNFFDLFSFEIVRGDPKRSLIAPRSVVLTESLSKRIFGDKDPIGESIQSFADLEYEITAICADPPRHSSLQFDQLISWTTGVPGVGPISFNWLNNWLAQAAKTYVRLQPAASVPTLESKLPAMMRDHFPERAEQYFWRFQPLKEVYLRSSDIRYQFGLQLGSIRFITILAISALLVLLIAMINHINISLSRATQHWKEVGVRKVLGSTRVQLVGRFVMETFVTCMVGAVLSFGLLLVALPFLNQATGRELPYNLFVNPLVIGAVILSVVGFSLAMGLYPALYLSRPATVQAIHANVITPRRGWGRRLVLVLQFGIALTLTLGCFAILKQTSFLKNTPLGFDADHLVVVDIDNEVAEKDKVFESELLSHPAFKSVSICRSAVGFGNYTTTFVPEGLTDELGVRVMSVDADFFPTYGIESTIGRSFQQVGIGDSLNVVVNQSLVEAAGWEDPIGRRLVTSSFPQGYPVIGVVEDFHYFSLATAKIEPVAMFLSVGDNRNASIRLTSGSKDEAIRHLESAWSQVADRTPLEYYFVDDWFAEQYSGENQLLRTTSLYAFFSLLLCALGLYGITALSLQRRRKEISVRKVLGSTTQEIMIMMNRQIVITILVGAVMAIPLGVYLARKWLNGFAYHTNLGSITIVAALLITGLLAIAIVSFLSYRVASSSPANYLKE